MGNGFVLAIIAMKFESPTQRGTTCMWKWSGTPAPAALPILAPILKPSGWNACLSTLIAFLLVQISRLLFQGLIGTGLLCARMVQSLNGLSCRDRRS